VQHPHTLSHALLFSELQHRQEIALLQFASKVFALPGHRCLWPCKFWRAMSLFGGVRFYVDPQLSDKTNVRSGTSN
jgi:hypothetical protein